MNSSILRKEIEEKIKGLEAERARIAPEWWSEWLTLNRPESELENNTTTAAAAKSHGGDEKMVTQADGIRPPPKDLKVD